VLRSERVPVSNRIVAAVTLLLLNVFTVSAAGAVVKLTPKRELRLEAPSVAGRVLVAPTQSGLPPAASTGKLPGAALDSRLNGLVAPYINAAVIDTGSRRVLYDQRGELGATPASTTKVVTSTAALATLGPGYRLTTKVVRSGAGSVVLVGGGDPTLAGPSMTPAKLAATYPRPASLVDLAQRTAAAVKAAGQTGIRVDYDASLYNGARLAPGWKSDYIGGDVAPITGLTIDEGMVHPGPDSEGAERVADPAATALQAFVKLLKKYGVTATAGRPVTAPRTAVQLAAVQSPPVSALVERLLTVSDNDLAEAMARQVGIKRGLGGSFAGGAQGVHDALAQLGVAQGVQTYDGSGLSRSNRISPLALARVVSTAASSDHPELRAVITGMPIAGFSGTLARRYDTGTTQGGAGVVRAKTGTLDGVNTLAGLTYDADGRLLAFAFMANKVSDPTAAIGALDRLATTVSACGC
jgi:D-alanyl-D-alanine carboxypeptidase